MDRFDELLKCIANYNNKFSIYAKQCSYSHNAIYFEKMHKKHYCDQLSKSLETVFNPSDINYIEMCLIWCFKNTFEHQNISELAKTQLAELTDEQYVLFKECIAEFNNLEY